MDGYDINIGGEILRKAAVDSKFADAYGKYFDNDRGAFANPHPDAMNLDKCLALRELMEQMI